MREFVPFPKIPRWKRDVMITEKIDGTNAGVHIARVNNESGNVEGTDLPVDVLDSLAEAGDIRIVPTQEYDFYVRASSRTRFIKPGSDNYAFAAWVWEHSAELIRLGPGAHFGEWFGKGIQRNYGLADRGFALFNASRWGRDGDQQPPDCCDVVPTLYHGPMSMPDGRAANDFWLQQLEFAGSQIAPGFKPPEGIIIYHVASRSIFKQTLDNDDQHKGG